MILGIVRQCCLTVIATGSRVTSEAYQPVVPASRDRYNIARL
jgi:hypothetical protein